MPLLLAHFYMVHFRSVFSFLLTRRQGHAPLPTSLSVTGSSDIGRVRRRNEDAMALHPESGVAVVADGMGGHPGGDVASEIAAATAAEALRAAAKSIKASGEYLNEMSPAVERAVLGAHEAIRARGEAEPQLDGMGTTLTGMVVEPGSRCWVIGHVGDSRAYLFRAGELLQLTRDDTWVQQQIDNAIMAPDQARRSPYAHLLTQCLGLEDTPAPHVFTGEGQAGDVYLLCTDGLVGMLDDSELTEILSRDVDADSETIAALVEAANEAGGHDNITAAIVRLG